MEVMFVVFAASTLALVVLQLFDYIVDLERGPLIEYKRTTPHAGPPGVASRSVAEPQAHYDWAA